jgi:hypothetical protein
MPSEVVRDRKASDPLTESSRVESSLTDSDAEGHNYGVSLKHCTIQVKSSETEDLLLAAS